MARYGEKHTIHKGKMGALQISPIPPTWSAIDSKGNIKVTKSGALLFEMAPFLKKDGDNLTYDWAKKKVTFAFGIPDIEKVVEAYSTGNKVDLIHDTDKGMKKMSWLPGEGDYEGTWRVSLATTKGEEKLSAMIALSYGEMRVLVELMVSIVPSLLGWNASFLDQKVERDEAKVNTQNES